KDLPVLELPTDRPRPAVQRFAGRVLSRTLPEDLVRSLRALVRGDEATLFMGLLAAFQALLHRYSGQEDVVVGSSIAGRNRRELEPLIGFFVNALPLRADLSGRPTFRQLLARVREAAVGAFGHQDVPFERLVAELQPRRDTSRSPIFQVLFQLQNTGVSAFELPGLVLSPVEVSSQTAKFDLALSLVPAGAGFEEVWKFNTALFEEATVARMSAHLRTLLAAAVADPERPVARLPLLTADEEQQLREWNDSAAGYPQDLCLHERIASQVRRTPERIAAACGADRLSYGELDSAASVLARRLRAAGVGPEVAVGVCAERSLELVVGILAVLKAGGAYLPLDPDYPAERLAYMIDDSRVPVVLAQERLAGRLGEHLERQGTKILPLDGCAAGRQTAVSLAPSGAGPDSLAYVIYTSGSTGRPKGTMNTHRGIVNRLLWMQERFGLAADDRVLQKTPFSFDVSVWELFWPLLTGARLVMARPGGHQDSAYLVAEIAGSEVTTLHFVPSMLQVFVEAPGMERCASLRRVICSGEALPPALVRRFFARSEAELHNLYGPTEAAVDVTSWSCERDSPGAVVPIGRPIANTRIHLLDRLGQGSGALPIGVPGELAIGGVQLARGYLRRPELTAERFVPDPFAAARGEAGARLYRTGDLARHLPDGTIDFLGRLDHQVKIRGLRIELGEIEAALAGHPALREAVVLPHVEGGGVLGAVNLAAYVTRRPDATPEPTLADLRGFLSRSLPEYMLPSALRVLDALPLTPSGKADRKALAALDLPSAIDAAPGERVPPRDALELFLARLWSETLGLAPEAFGVHDNFFRLGGNSITGAMFINRLQEELREIVHVVTIFDAPTIGELAAYLAAEVPAAAARMAGAATPVGSVAAAGPTVDAARLADLRPLLRTLTPLPPALAGAPRNPPAVFLLSPPRSGSTLLRVMLGGNPRLFAPPELELLGFNDLRERRQAFAGRDAFRLEGAIRAVVETRGCSVEEARELIAAGEEEALPTQELYRWLQGWIGGRMLVDKTPTYAWDRATLERAEEIFAGARYLHLARHPAATIRSFEEARIDQIFLPQADTFARRELAELLWMLAHENILEFLAGVPPERQHAVRFEDLLAAPERVLGDICGFLGIAYHPDMAEPYKDGSARMTDGLHAASRMLGDVKFHQHSGIDASVAERSREAGGVALSEATRALSARLGYEIEAEIDAPVGPSWQRIESRAGVPGTPLPLSFSQERFWFLDQLERRTAVYNMFCSVRLRGALDPQVLARSFGEIVRRHQVLRSVFAVVDGGPIQIVRPAVPFPLPQVDLSGLPPTARQAEAERLSAAESVRPFDLGNDVLLRAMVLPLTPATPATPPTPARAEKAPEEAEHLLFFVVHHIAFDGWSLRVMLRELPALYRAFAAGASSPLPEPAIQYADFAVWQRRQLAGERREAELAYWRRQLAGNPPPLLLPADRRRSAVQGFSASGRERVLPARLLESAAAFSRERAVSLYVTLLAVWQALLLRTADQEDWLLGAPTAGRNRPEIDNLIGLFLNTLVLRTDLSGDPPFGQLVDRVRRTTLEAFAHQDLPIEQVLQAMSPAAGPHDPGRGAPFQAMFLFQNLPSQEVSVPGLTFSVVQTDRRDEELGTALFEVGLTLSELEDGGALLAEVTYNALLFEPATMDRLLARYERLLAGTMAEAGRPVWDYDLLSAEERQELLVWGDPASGPAAGRVAAETAPVQVLFE
ncbi:MAG TPA: amino acid adenylation domain-containing protein, partial [Thermoanaerobaculia bacterium]|nr:amino acid adenylation domain-containing protein [Thermoanaerobaculia bacterium]